MKRIFERSALLALVLSVAPLTGVAGQQPYIYQGVPDATEYLEFLGGSGVNGGYGVQVGPYLGHFQGDPATAQFSIYCVDFTHYAKSQWVSVNSLAGDLSQTRLGSAYDPSEAYEKYWKAAYLSSLFDTAPEAAWGGIHAAIWQYTSNVYKGNTDLRNLYVDQADLAFAEQQALDFDASGWYVVSPTYGATGQEFLMRTVSVPEPAAFLLLASGLLLLAAFSRRRLRGVGEYGA